MCQATKTEGMKSINYTTLGKFSSLSSPPPIKKKNFTILQVLVTIYIIEVQTIMRNKDYHVESRYANVIQQPFNKTITK